jgi:hypothetical protein
MVSETPPSVKSCWTGLTSGLPLLILHPVPLLSRSRGGAEWRWVDVELGRGAPGSEVNECNRLVTLKTSHPRGQ